MQSQGLVNKNVMPHVEKKRSSDIKLKVTIDEQPPSKTDERREPGYDVHVFISLFFETASWRYFLTAS
jgi:hypothetical protein